ncbi:hypothetical protein BBOV_I000490 [Babesia bovis T2Bo]|uniref:hypothetical protein n=1 Tax=Babesia bovis T2Bo TaxID=484906 RepID=UPI001C367DB3|nr:hypothetical protein BBOV_I000490 [Babesia bovis T2Bo]EDO05143.2 hypothetical protein BBOV_I000490 [Babesia bovis T2Bo]
MHIGIKRVCSKRILHTKANIFEILHNEDIAIIPERVLSLLPKASQKCSTSKDFIDEATSIVKYIDQLSPERLKNGILKNHGRWIAAIQRAQAYGLRLTTPMVILKDAFENEQLKLKGLSSREFATLASICASQRTEESYRILKLMCHDNIVAWMIPDLNNSDFALFLSSLAKTGNIHRVSPSYVESQLFDRMNSMSTFDISLAFDALSAYRRRNEALTNLALKRFAELLESNDYDISSVKKTISSIGSRMASNAKYRVKGDDKWKYQPDSPPMLNDIAMFIRSMSRSDSANVEDLTYLQRIVTQLNRIYRYLDTGALLHDKRVLPNSTTVLMALSIWRTKYGDYIHDIGMDRLIVTILLYIAQPISLPCISIKERTKICIAIQAFWHLANGKRYPELVNHVYRSIVNPDDPQLLMSLSSIKTSGSNGDIVRDIYEEVNTHLIDIICDDAKCTFITEVTMPPYVTSVLDLRGYVKQNYVDNHPIE